MGEKNNFYGRHHSEETKARLRETSSGRRNECQLKPVRIDGVEYDSLSAAARAIGKGPPLVLFRIRSANPKFAGYEYIEDTNDEQPDDSLSRLPNPYCGTIPNGALTWQLAISDYRAINGNSLVLPSEGKLSDQLIDEAYERCWKSNDWLGMKMAESLQAQVGLTLADLPVSEDSILYKELTFDLAVQEYYSLPGNGVGGNLHIVLDDFNIRDSDLAHCRKQSQERSDWLGLKIIDFLSRFNELERTILVRGGPPSY